MVWSYELVDYFDVWGNEKDGWDINDSCVVEQGIMIEDCVNDKEIVKLLADKGYLSTSDMRRIAVQSYGENIEICQRKYMKPLYELRKER